MAVLRTIVGVLLALFLIASGILPALLKPARYLGPGDPYSAWYGKQSTLYGRQSIAYAAPAAAPSAAPAIVDDAVIVLDVTGSMRGEGPDPRVRDIWQKTVGAVLDIVDRLAPQTNLAVVPFSNGPEWRNVFPGPIARGSNLTPRQLTGDADREAFRAHLRKLVASGEFTWIYESLEYSLIQLRQWREADPGNTHRQALFLYTDGIDNGPNAKLGIDGIVQLLQAQKADSRNLYFVYNDLGSYLSPEQKAKLTAAGVTVTSGPPTSNVELVTENLDFGDLLMGSSAVSRDISFRSGFGDVWGKPIRLRIEVVGSTSPMILADETVQLREQVKVALRLTGSVPAGQQQARLIIEPVDSAFNLIPRNSIDVTFLSVAPTPTAVPEPTPTPVPAPPRSIIEGVPDALLLLGILALVVVGVLAVRWKKELWPFKGFVPTTQLIWKRDGVPTRSTEDGVRIRTIRPNKSRTTEVWLVGIEGYISLPDGDQRIKPKHAMIVYRGGRKRNFRLIPMEGEVQANGRSVASEGMALTHGSTFVIGPYHFRFEDLDGIDQKPEHELTGVRGKTGKP